MQEIGGRWRGEQDSGLRSGRAQERGGTRGCGSPPGGAGVQPRGSFPIGLLRNLLIPHVRLQLSQQELSDCGRGSKTGFNKCLTLLG